MYVKIHKSSKSEVIAICDEDLIGRVLKDKGIEFKISEFFYKGQIMNESETLELLKSARNVNIIGKKSVKLALDNDIITKEFIIKTEDVPHAQIFSI